MFKKFIYAFFILGLSISSNSMEDPREKNLEPKEDNNNFKKSIIELNATKIACIKFYGADNKFVISTANNKNNSIQIWDAETKKLIAQVSTTELFSLLLFHPSVNILTALLNEKVAIWDLDRQSLYEPQRRYNKNINKIAGDFALYSYAYYKNIPLALFAYNDGSAIITSVSNGLTRSNFSQAFRTICKIEPDETRSLIYFVAFSNFCKFALLAKTNGNLKIIKAPDNLYLGPKSQWEEIHALDFRKKIISVKFSPKNANVFIFTEEGNYVLNLHNEDIIKTKFVDYCPKTQTFLEINENSLFVVDLMVSLEEKKLIISEQSAISKAYYNDAGNLIVTILANGDSNIWYKKNNEWSHAAKCTTNDNIVLSPQGSRFIIYQSNSSQIALYELRIKRKEISAKNAKPPAQSKRQKTNCGNLTNNEQNIINVEDDNIDQSSLEALLYNWNEADIACLVSNLNVNNQDELGNTALHYAIINNDQEEAKKLLKLGANQNLPNHEGKTPLYLVLATGKIEFIKIFLEADDEERVLDNVILKN